MLSKQQLEEAKSPTRIAWFAAAKQLMKLMRIRLWYGLHPSMVLSKLLPKFLDCDLGLDYLVNKNCGDLFGTLRGSEPVLVWSFG